ncbi:hypothetical protein GGTG_11874 [Gaeumannomyces tritici R3-111a-1]|uniref:Glutathione S-transferase n=1 Tax=Gaeumannomyces tritici (strain R3-111a-1) TaxID=644352 RepID=J3PEE3_GAET3|nr:hypothetical protein GGTG_11874 [Gaeumannomyces tritici R3-111a-1]EJT70851.1 hypothetical protein GGTG_11874 [Gaeumannomyces tritici R3-111a-1]
MAPFATIYAYPDNPRVKRAQVIAALNGLELHVPGPDEWQFGVANQAPEWKAKFPLGKVPAMETADGLRVTEGGAICAHIAGSGPLADQLLGKTVAERSLVWRWSLFADSELVGSVIPVLIGYVFKLAPANPAAHDAAAAGLQRALVALDAEFKDGKAFLVGDKLSMADVMVGGALFFAAGFMLDEEMAKAAPNVVKYMAGLSTIPEIKNVFGEWKPTAVRIPKE